MQQYIWNLLVLVLGASSTFIITPCQAQTPVESNSKNPNNISSISSDPPPAIELSDSASSIKSEPPILTEAARNSSASNANIATTKPEPRIPIFSRVFRSPSMQQ
jgi:hypothetical protein